MSDTTTASISRDQVISPAELLAHWQGHRGLTRKVIEAFPEEAFFAYSLGGMRTFAAMAMELLAIGSPGIREIATKEGAPLNEHFEQATSKAILLELWDKATDEINEYWEQIPIERFHDRITTFGQYEGSVYSSILYFIDNEIHHRGQGYVYLRSLGIEPPPFWAR